MKRKKRLTLLLFALLLLMTCTAAAAEQWKEIATDAKYGKYFAPSHVKIEEKVNTVPTRLSAWTKTTYTAAGAAETIENYGIQSAIPNPANLAYSTALIEIRPQTRELEYVQENFYNATGTRLWSKVYDPRTKKEINSQSFDEDFFVAIVDSVFHHGEIERQKADDRWRMLWTSAENGVTTTAKGDMTTMRYAGNNLIYWEWRETKGTDGNITEVQFAKKAVNLEQGTEKIIDGKLWTATVGWSALDVTDGRYTAIKPGTPQEKGLTHLRAISKGFTYWLNRYRTDMSKNGKTPKKPSNPEPK